MNKHTPGPWEVRFHNGQIEGIYTTKPSPKDVEISGDFAGLIVETDCGFYPPKLEDARLISAAPELLQMLQEIVNKNLLNGAMLKDARTAIAKATGETK